jgi:hypothetical protein
VFLKNLGVKTTIETYRLALTVDGMTRSGERITLDDHYFRKPGIADARINDIEYRNDEPLEYSRDGWLRYIIRAAFKGLGHPEKAQMHVELEAIDIKGISHPLDELPQSHWHYDAHWATKHIRMLANSGGDLFLCRFLLH